MNHLEEAIKKAREFVFSNRDDSGLWKDFETRTHGESIDWVSSYIGLCLLNSGIPKSDLELTANSISKRQNEEHGGWGYNEKIVPDADSTAFSILFLSHFDYDLNRAKDFLLAHQKSDGSFGTYIPELIKQYYRIPTEMSIDGWCSGIPDVTATALQALGEGKEAVEYIKKHQADEGFWRAYWYNNDIYSTVHGIRAIKGNGSGNEIEKAQDWLARQKIIPDVPFYMALSLQGFMTNGSFGEQIENGIKRLLDLQQKDGSWGTYPILRFPLPSNLEPWNDSSRWREESKDQNRVFTTATCLQTLSQYEERSS